MKESGLSRRDFLKSAFGGAVLGTAAFLEACGKMSQEEIELMPLAKLDDIIDNPEKYAQVESIKTTGYIQEVGEEQTVRSVTRPTGKYVWSQAVLEYSRHLYKISEDAKMTGKILPAVSIRKMINNDEISVWENPPKGPYENVIKPSFPKTDEGQEYEIIGRVILAKDKNENGKYSFEIARIDLPESK